MSRPRVVLDTNVVISAVLFGGPPRRVLDLAISGVIGCFVSPPMLEELSGVLGRTKFGFSAAERLQIIEEIQAVFRIVEPSSRINRVTVDPADNRVLECAVEARAEFIVTGDAHLLDLGEFQGTKIVKPAEFLGQADI